MIKHVIAVVSLVFLLGCAGSYHGKSSGDSIVRRSGTFELAMFVVKESGTIVFKADSSNSTIYLYTFMGIKVAELNRRLDSLTLVQGDDSISFGLLDTIRSSSLIPLSMPCGELYQILSGEIPEHLKKYYDTLQGEIVVNDSEKLTVERSRAGIVAAVRIESPHFMVEYRNYDHTHFESIRLTYSSVNSSTNYFQITYE